MGITYREAILETIRLSLLDIDSNEVGDDPYEWSFSEVVRGPLPDVSKTKLWVGAVVPGEERKVDEMGFRTCFLQVMTDFRFTRNKGDPEPAVIAEILLGIIQRRLLKDRQLNFLAIDFVDTGNAIDLDSSTDNSVEGSVFWEVQYRHDVYDPRILFGEVPATPTAISRTLVP